MSQPNWHELSDLLSIRLLPFVIEAKLVELIGWNGSLVKMCEICRRRHKLPLVVVHSYDDARTFVELEVFVSFEMSVDISFSVGIEDDAGLHGTLPER